MITARWFGPGEDLGDPFLIRETVFMKEQGFADEFDELDASSHHLVLYEGDRPIACGRLRLYPEHKNDYKMERIAVLAENRGQGLGARIMEEMEQKALSLGGNRAWLHAQCRAEEFYRKLGYAAAGEPDFEEYCPHIMMRKTLGNAFDYEWEFREGMDRFVVRAEDKLIAVGEGRLQKEGAYQITRLAVLEEARGRGFGETVLYNLERHGLSKGADTAVLETPQLLEPFFSRRGYSSYGDNRKGVVYLLKALEPWPETPPAPEHHK